VKAAAAAAAVNYTNHRFKFTKQTGQKWNNLGSETGFEVDYYQSFLTHSTGEASELGMLEKDIVDAIIVQAKPPPVPPTWRASTLGLQAIAGTLEKTGGEEGWGNSGVVSDEAIKYNAQREGIAWNVDLDFVPTATEQQIRNNNHGGDEYFTVRLKILHA
jgi:hypothetical protein